MNKATGVTLDRIFEEMKRHTPSEEERLDDETRGALERLIAVALNVTGQSERVANLLLAWYDGHENGGFILTDFWSLDDTLVDDSLLLITWVSRNRFYPTDIGYTDQFRAIWRMWRSKT